MALRFQIALHEEGGVLPLLPSAARHLVDLTLATQMMVRQMQAELWGYLAIPVTVGDHGMRLDLSRDPTSLRNAWNAATGRIGTAYTPPSWLRARTRMWRYLNGDLSTVGSTEAVDVQTTLDGDPLIGFVFDGIFGIDVNPFTWWTPSAGEVLEGTPEGRAAVGPTMMLLHELDHRHSAINSGSDSTVAGFRSSVTLSAEDATVADIDLSMSGHPDVAQRGWYGDTQLMRGEHYRQAGPGHTYFMGTGRDSSGMPDAVAFGDRFGRGEVSAQDWQGAWVRFPDRDTLLTGRRPTSRPQPATTRAAVTSAAAPRTPASPAVAPPTTTQPSPAGHRHRGRGHSIARSAGIAALQRAAGNRVVGQLARAGQLDRIAASVPSCQTTADTLAANRIGGAHQRGLRPR
jgi:hypothetical protein